MSPVNVNVGGAWKSAASVHTKVSGSWKTASDMPVKIGGVWKTGILASTAYESIATVTASGGETSLNFTSIPSTYTSLQLRWIARTSRGGPYGYFAVRFNSDSSSSYTKHSLWVDGTNVNSTGQTGTAQSEITYGASGSTAGSGTFGTGILDLHNYTSTTQSKTYRSFDGNNNNGTGNIELCSGLWTNTAAITAINLVTTAHTFLAGTTFSLYGIKGA